ncbi:MAG: 4-hydroxy-tetrahydrodipicolinate reductase [Cyclobacteriaceae bacterium]
MNIALIGYGKMGQTIEKIAKDRGHVITAIVDERTETSITELNPKETDVAIEFTQPGSAYDNLQACIDIGIPVISGTTGWLERYDELKSYANKKNGTLLYSSNFSLGVNLFFKVNEYVAKLMSQHSGYGVQMEEIHHTQKKDAPSGTAITLAEGIIKNNDRFSGWVNQISDKEKDLSIISKRIDEVPGTHAITYKSEEDEITLTHTAHSRQGFALGAVLVAEWVHDKSGVFTMDDFLGFN